jgi:hypothetical protein
MTIRETIVPIAAPTIHFENPNPINQEIIDDDIDDVPNDSSHIELLVSDFHQQIVICLKK